MVRIQTIPEELLDLADEVWCREDNDGLAMHLLQKLKRLEEYDRVMLELLCQALWGDERLLTVYRHLNCMLS